MAFLAHPLAVSVPELAAHVAREAFVAALDDASLQLKVVEKEPESIEAVLRIASKLEAYESILYPKGTPQAPEGGKGQRKYKEVYSVETNKTDKDAQLQQQIAELKEVARLKSQKDKCGPCTVWIFTCNV